MSKTRQYVEKARENIAFGKEFAKTGLIKPDYHQRLRDAFQTRQASDYIIDRNISIAQAQEVISWAKELLSEAEQILR